jgi:hypothetical protein
VEQNLINDPSQYNWSYVFKHPELIELHDLTDRERLHNAATIVNSYSMEAWPVSLFI